jgi:hypothetical protein
VFEVCNFGGTVLGSGGGVFCVISKFIIVILEHYRNLYWTLSISMGICSVM